MTFLILEIIAIFSLATSLVGMLMIFLQKAPVLKALPETMTATEGGKRFFSVFCEKAKFKIKNLPLLKSFSFVVFLQKILSKSRVLSLKLESKIASWLEALRKKSQANNSKKPETESNHYWQDLQKDKDNDNPPM